MQLHLRPQLLIRLQLHRQTGESGAELRFYFYFPDFRNERNINKYVANNTQWEAPLREDQMDDLQRFISRQKQKKEEGGGGMSGRQRRLVILRLSSLLLFPLLPLAPFPSPPLCPLPSSPPLLLLLHLRPHPPILLRRLVTSFRL